MPDAEIPFLDTNIVLYALSQDESKRQRAIDLLVDGPVISAQVLSEASNVLARKCGLAPNRSR
jgi:predicted nucleic acid-binding protein